MKHKTIKEDSKYAGGLLKALDIIHGLPTNPVPPVPQEPKNPHTKTKPSSIRGFGDIPNPDYWLWETCAAVYRPLLKQANQRVKELEKQLDNNKPFGEGSIVIACSGGCGKTTNDVSPAEFWTGKVEQSPDPEELVPVWTCRECVKALSHQEKREGNNEKV